MAARSRVGSIGRVARAAALAVAAPSVLAACAPPLETGEWGTFRFVADVPGRAPLRLLPPVSDREGNLYVLYGAPDRAEATAFVGFRDGGWSGGCDGHKGESRGVHGWIGEVERAAWYWSGDALVRVDGASGACRRVLDRDPSSNADLLFEGVLPWVDDSPSRVTVPAIVRAVSDPRPYLVVVDLLSDRYLAAREFQPADATDVRIAGTGQADGEGFYVATYLDGGGTRRAEARFVDAGARETAAVEIPGGTVHLGRDAVRGYLQADEHGLVAGLLESGQLLLFDRSQARRLEVSGMEPAGVHRWKGALFLVGTRAGRPVIASIGEEGIGSPRIWTASERAAERLGRRIEVVDEREAPTRYVDWTDPSTAIGPFPFVHAHRPDRYSADSTGWLIAGPSYQTGVEGMTSVAFGPVGLSYP